MVSTPPTPYPFEKSFEEALAVALCCRPRLFLRFGAQVDGESITNEVARLLITTAQACARAAGPPDNAVIVMQRLRRMMFDGKVSQEQIHDCVDLISRVEESGIPDEAQLAAEVIPVLRLRAQTSALHDVIDAHGKRSDLNPSIAKLQQAVRLGETETEDGGIQIGMQSFEAIERLKSLVRMPLGIPEIDTIMQGGLWRGALGVVVMNTGGGKSMFMSHQTGSAMLHGARCAYATLELPVPIVLARIKANLTGVPIDSILEGSQDAMHRLEELLPHLGACTVRWFTPRATSVEDIIGWVKALELKDGNKIDFLVVDYGDKLGLAKIHGIKNSYDTGGIVFETMRIYAHEEGKWVWTGSQAQRGGKDAKKKLDLQYIADSIEKARVGDYLLTALESEDGTELTWYSAKNRMGTAHLTAGPLPHEFAYGRVAALVERPEDLFDGLNSW